MGGRRRRRGGDARRGAVESREPSYTRATRAGHSGDTRRRDPWWHAQWPRSSARATLDAMHAVDPDETEARRYHRRQFALTLVDLALGVLVLMGWSWSGAAAGLATALDARLRSAAAVVAAMTPAP